MTSLFSGSYAQTVVLTVLRFSLCSLSSMCSGVMVVGEGSQKRQLAYFETDALVEGVNAMWLIAAGPVRPGRMVAPCAANPRRAHAARRGTAPMRRATDRAHTRKGTSVSIGGLAPCHPGSARSRSAHPGVLGL